MVNIINLNTAQLDELTSLPGVGPAMADRIVAARPYETFDDLQLVSGIGPAIIERLAPLVVLEEIDSKEDVIYLEADTETLSQELESITDVLEPEPEIEGEPTEDIIPKEKAIIRVNETESQPEPEIKGPKPVTWGRTLLVMTTFSLVTFTLAVLLTLGIIGTLNNGLRYASPTDIQELNNQAKILDSQIGTLQEDFQGFRLRLDNLEGVPAQIGELNNATDQLSADIANTVEIVGGMNTQIEELQNSTSSFQVFLDGLAELMGSLVDQPQEIAPEETP